MKATLSPSDIFEIRKLSLISSNDYEYALDLYAPIIGIKNLSVYFAFIAEGANEQKPLSSFLGKYRLSSGELESALSYLEAVGLIATYRKNIGKKAIYLYSVMAPRTPSQFFSNELLYGTLRSFLSEEECKNISKKYQTDSVEEGYENVSERFVDVFHLNLGNASILQSGPKTGERRFGSLQLGFDTNAFMSSLAEVNPTIKPAYITKDEIKRIARIAALYSYEESAMASFVGDSYHPRNTVGTRIDFERLSELAIENVKYDYLHKEQIKPTSSDIHGDAPTAKVIRMMDNMSTIQFLTKLQRGNKPAPSDIKLINTLVVDMGVPENVANALIFYVLGVQENALSGAYVTKLGASLVRAGITNALDALNFLGGHAKRNGKKTSEPAKPIEKKVEPTKESEVVDEVEEEEVDEDEFEQMMKNRGRK
ncbi:MAG: hypothetical protein K6G74_00305 [Bacilli bacterium]|nr:hypothetical protein [Bacilli bacterium]